MIRSKLTTLLLAAFVLAGLVLPVRAESPKTSKEATASTEKSKVVVLRLEGALSETPADETMALFGQPGTSLLDLVRKMKKASDDSTVKAVVILCDEGGMGIAQIEEVRQAMKSLRAAGKDVYAHCGSIGMGQYMLLAGASRLSVVPTGDIWVDGLYSEQPYVRGLLNKLGVTPDYLTCGDYKSAGEIFMREGPSPEADAMLNWLFDGIFSAMISEIAEGRNVSTDKAKSWIDNGPYTAGKAKENGMIDAVEQRQDFENFLRSKYGEQVVFDKKYGQPKQPTLDLSSPFGVFKFLGESIAAGKAKQAQASKDAVGIVYVVGPIQEGSGDDTNPLMASEGAYSSKIRKALDEAAADDAIKAVVLRVDSPGGSAVASEIILDATRRVIAKKPFIVSMGNVAGSGGYYVSCASDTIFADESTITASIGVVAGKFVTTDMWEKVGIKFKPYKRGTNAGMLNSSEPFTSAERERMQKWMDEIYDTFKGHVVAIRGSRLKKPIDEIAGGRVFTGQQALELGLVDKIGTLQDAIAHVASDAKLSEYDVRVVPAPKNFIEKILEETSGADKDPKHVAIGAMQALSRGGSLIDAALPYLQGLDPTRVALIRTALWRMQLMQKEGVIIMMPEIAIGN